MTNFRLHDEQTVNGVKKNWLSFRFLFETAAFIRKWQLSFAQYAASSKHKLQTSVFFSANRKRNFVFLGWQKINSNGCLLFQQTCPSTYEH
jgi:hypothetical protein